MNYNETVELPDVASQLIYLAIEDLIKTEKDEDYSINMSLYHGWGFCVVGCQVCLAGAVMAKTLECDYSEDFIPSDFPYSNELKLRALDYFRVGEVWAALGVLNIDRTKLDGLDLRSVTITPYAYSPECFIEDMLALAGTLDGIGL